MKIAIVAPCPMPYMVGGAEKLWWGLATHFNANTPHQAEIIKLPAPEHDLRSVMASYESFSTLDLDGFDLVISGKYPAWMVRHPRHVCYMLHRLRGLYDCYYGERDWDGQVAAHPRVAALRAFMARNAGERAALSEFFGRWNELLVDGSRPAAALAYPGPLARDMVQWLDGIALSPSAIVRYAAISATVARRAGYFPAGVEVAVAHPPPSEPMAPGERFEHFYTVSRLDVPKRVGLIVEAMRRVRTDASLIVGGAGPEEARLREIAAGDPRIRFAGFQSNAEVRESYRNALAIPFVPWEEDYGLIAVEAMQCGKPVITMKDSGGPCELVEDGVNGFVCDHRVESLAAAMQRFADDPRLAREMGASGAMSARRITWEAVADCLLAAEPQRRPAPAARRKLVLASTFSIYPPRHGGQSRTFHLFRALADEFETVIVSVCGSAERPFDAEIAPGVREVRVPMSPEHERRERRLQAEVGTPITDVAMPRLSALTPAIRETLEREAVGACAVVASHPYFYPLLKGLGLPVWYEAQDFELHMKTALLEKLPHGKDLIAAVEEVEGACVRAAEVILCASAEDGAELVRVYGAAAERILDVPNGTDTQRIVFTDAEARAGLRDRLAIADSPIAFFMGSGHWPNIEAVKRIFEFALELPEAAFLVIGSVCYAFDPKLKPANILFMGEVDDVTRDLCLQACEVALNPIEHGAGTNIKMLDYFAAGVPVISTARGARGLRLEGETQCLVRPIERFSAAIREVAEQPSDAARRALAARELVEREFDWDSIGRRILPRLVELADRRDATQAPGPARARARKA